jgi:hypothetical protein
MLYMQGKLCKFPIKSRGTARAVWMCSSGVEYSSIPAISTPSTRYRLLDVHCIGRSRGRQRLRDYILSGDGEPPNQDLLLNFNGSMN